MPSWEPPMREQKTPQMSAFLHDRDDVDPLAEIDAQYYRLSAAEYAALVTSQWP